MSASSKIPQIPRAWRSSQLVRRLLRIIARSREAVAKRRRTRESEDFVKAVLPLIPEAEGITPAAWSELRVLTTVTDMTVLTLAAPGRPPAAVLKLPRTEPAAASLRREKQVLRSLQQDVRLGGWSGLLPTVLASGEVAGRPYLVQKAISGAQGATLLARGAPAAELLLAATSAIGDLHRHTATPRIVDESLLEHVLGTPVEEVRSAMPKLREGARAAAVDHIERDVTASLAGRTVPVGWIHGDFAPTNILFSEEGTTVSGVVDWELATPAGLPLLDVLQLLISTRMLLGSCELGDVVAGLLEGDGWGPEEAAVLAAAASGLPGEPLELRPLLLLCWLDHVRGNLRKSRRYLRSPLWSRANVDPVLRSASRR